MGSAASGASTRASARARATASSFVPAASTASRARSSSRHSVAANHSRRSDGVDTLPISRRASRTKLASSASPARTSRLLPNCQYSPSLSHALSGRLATQEARRSPPPTVDRKASSITARSEDRSGSASCIRSIAPRNSSRSSSFMCGTTVAENAIIYHGLVANCPLMGYCAASAPIDAMIRSAISAGAKNGRSVCGAPV